MTLATRDSFGELLNLAGIEINGKRPFDIAVHDERFYSRVLNEGSMGLGESYMDGWWDVERLDEFIDKATSANLPDKLGFKKKVFWLWLLNLIFNLQSRKRAFIVGEKHYDVGNDLYVRMLDSRLSYTCGYWKKASNLEEAQEHKLDLICRKLNLKKRQKVLDLGCGWGSFAKFAATRYGGSVVGVTVSKEQAKFGRKLCAGLPVDIRLSDYREVKGEFDHVVAIGLFEHVGYKNYRNLMETVHKLLKKDGLFLLHTIGRSDKTVINTDPWINKYVFPNGMLPSIKQIGGAIEGLFVMEDWHNFGADYDKTLMAWFKNFDERWGEIKDKYSERFYRMWKYYLLTCAGSFRARKNQLWQIVLCKDGLRRGYDSVR